MVEEMTNMMSSQRALQSAAQVLRMYDQIMSKSVTDIGRM
jgi:flagellar basal-body rod protein FlgG